MTSFHKIYFTTCVVWISCNFYGRSSMVPGSRNPMWGEEFNFSVDELPVQVSATISHFLFQKDLKLWFLCSVLNFTLLWSPHHRFKVQTWHDLQKLFREQWFCCIIFEPHAFLFLFFYVIWFTASVNTKIIVLKKKDFPPLIEAWLFIFHFTYFVMQNKGNIAKWMKKEGYKVRISINCWNSFSRGHFKAIVA